MSSTSLPRRSTATHSRSLKGSRRCIQQHFRAGQLVILIPDAASKQRATAAAQESDIGILKRAGHQVKAQQSNPIIQDRVNALNMLIEQRKIKVGNGCKHLIRTFEQHAYDEKGRVSPRREAWAWTTLSSRW